MEPVYVQIDGRKVSAGWVKGEVFEKEITGRSIFWNSRSLRTEKGVIAKLVQRGVERIRLIRRDTGEILEIPLSTFLEHAFPLSGDEELLCQLKHFTVAGRDTRCAS